MPQKQFTNYRDQVNSYPLGESRIGLHKPGRYNGFDNGEGVGGMNMSISHSGSIPKTLNNGIPENSFGALLFPSGMIIHDTDNVYVTLDQNNDTNDVRIDLLICEHDYQAVAGGTPAVYSVVKGPIGGSPPSLPNPEKQIIVGRFTVPAGAINSENVTYIAEAAPLPGDMSIDLIAQLIQTEISVPDASETTKGKAMIASQDDTYIGTNDTKIVTPKKLNNRTSSETRTGLIALATQEEVNSGTNESKAVVPSKLKVLFDTFSQSINNVLNGFNQTLTNFNQTLTNHNTRIKTLENLINSVFTIGMVIEFDQPYTVPPPRGFENYFGRDGLVGVPYKDSDPDFGTLGAISGEKTHQLTENEMPAHKHKFTARTPYNGNLGGFDGGGNQFKDEIWETQTFGGNQAHNNLQPYKVIRLIRFVGYPTP